MSWTQLLGHEREKNILQRAILENRIAHAYCFQGIEGIGKESLAIQFAKTVNCENPIKSGKNIDSCNACKSCKSFDKLSHNNLDLIFPLPAPKGTKKDDNDPYSGMTNSQMSLITEELKKKANDNFYKINLDGAKQIKIASIRNIKKKLALSSNIKGHRFVIVFDSEKMTGESANAFLKTLEEPHEKVTIILVTSRHDLMLQTILSRCQQLTISPIPQDILIKYLVDYHNFEKADATIAAVISQGSVLKALDSVSEETRKKRDDIVNILRSALTKRNYAQKLIPQIKNIVKENEKTELPDYLKYLILWLKDSYDMRFIDNNNLINPDNKDSLKKFSTFYNTEKTPEVIELIEESIYSIKGNVDVELTLVRLFLKIREIFLDM